MDLIHKRSISNFIMISMVVVISANLAAGPAAAEKPLGIESATPDQKTEFVLLGGVELNLSPGEAYNLRVVNTILDSFREDGLLKDFLDCEIRFFDETAVLSGVAENEKAILRASELTRQFPEAKTIYNRIRLASEEPLEVVVYEERNEERERAERRENEQRERHERAEMEARERREIRELEERERREHEDHEHNPLEQVEKLHRAAEALHEAGMHREADELHHRAEQMERAWHEHQQSGEHHPPAEHLQHELMGNLKEIHHAIHALRLEVAQMREEMHHLRMQLKQQQPPHPPEAFRPAPEKKFTQPKPPQPERLKAVPKPEV